MSGLEDALFNTYLLEDASYLLVALLVIFLCVWGFTTSLTLTLACLSSIIGDTIPCYYNLQTWKRRSSKIYTISKLPARSFLMIFELTS